MDSLLFFWGIIAIRVEPPNNGSGHVWDPLFSGHFVLCWEVVLYRRLRTIGKSPFGPLNLVLCSEVISIFSFIGGSTVFYYNRSGWYNFGRIDLSLHLFWWSFIMEQHAYCIHVVSIILVCVCIILSGFSFLLAMVDIIIYEQLANTYFFINSWNSWNTTNFTWQLCNDVIRWILFKVHVRILYKGYVK